MGQLLDRIKLLEKRLDALENRGPQGNRLKEMADWILEQYEDGVKSISISKMMKMGAKKGYSRQMLGIARRTHLEDKVVAVVAKGKGWSWEIFE